MPRPSASEKTQFITIKIRKKKKYMISQVSLNSHGRLTRTLNKFFPSMIRWYLVEGKGLILETDFLKSGIHCISQ